MANGILEMVRRLSVLEKDVRRISTWERPVVADGGGGGGDMEIHALDPADGPWHIGTLRWATVNKSGSNLADLQTRNYISLTNRTHDIVGGDHSFAAGKWSLVGATADNTLGALVPASVVSGPTYEAILKSDAAGGLELVTLKATASVRTPLLYSAGVLTLQSTGPTNDILINPGKDVVLAANRRFNSAGANMTGYGGNGFGIWTDGDGKAFMETDDLTVRGRMNVYELMIRQIRSTNGNLLVSSSSRAFTVALTSGTSGAVGSTYTITVDEGTYHGFIEGDLIRAKRWKFDGNNQAIGFQSDMTVTSVTNLTTYVAQLNAGDAPQVGFDYVRHGSTTEVDRQGMVYIAADDTNSPTISIINGVASWADWTSSTKLKGLIGNLTGSAIGSPSDPVTGKEYGIAFGTGWTYQDQYVKVSNRTVLLNKVTLRTYNGTVETLRIEPTGVLRIGKDISQDALTSFLFTASTGILTLGRPDIPAITFNGTTGASTFTGVMTIATSGEIRQGVGTAGSTGVGTTPWGTWTGFRLWAENAYGGQVGRIGGYKDGVLQWSANVDGYIMAGAGATFINAGGIGISRATGGSDPSSNALTSVRGVRWFVDAATGNTPMASVVAGEASGRNYISLNAYNGVLNASLALWDLGGGLFSLWLNNIDTVVGFPGIGLATKSPGGGFDEAIRFGVTDKVARDAFLISNNIDTSIAAHWLPDVSDTRDLGSVGRRWNTLHVKTLIAESTVGGETLTGQIWQFDGSDMYIRSDAAATRTLYVANPNASGVMHLDVEGNITLGGTVDGIDIGALSLAFANHVTDNPNAHHNQQHALVGPDHTATGLTAGHVLKATGSDAFGFAALTLGDIPNFEAQVKDIIGDTVVTGGDLTFTYSGGLVTGEISDGAVSNAKLTNMAEGMFKGRALGSGTGDPQDLDAIALREFIKTVDGTGSLIDADTTDGVHLRGSGENQILLSGVSPYTGVWTDFSAMIGVGLAWNAGTKVISLGAPVVPISVSSTNSVTGTTHNHAIQWSSNPGGNSRILGTDSGGGVTTVYLTATENLTTNTIQPYNETFVYIYGDMQVGGDLTVDDALTAATGTFTTYVRTPVINTASGNLTLSPATGITTLAQLQATTRVNTPLLDYTGAMAISPTTTLTLSPTNYVILADGKAFRSTNFVSGFAGNGFLLDINGLVSGKSYLEVDSLTVRGAMNIYELVVQKIRSTNGNIFVASTFKVTNVTGTGPYVLTAEPEMGNNAAVGDIMRAQRWQGGLAIIQSDVLVTAVSGLTATVTLLDGNVPTPGWEYARLGNVSNTARQGGMYLSADDSGAPFIDVWNGVSDRLHWNNAAANAIKVRMGRLDGIFSSTNEYGIAAGNTGFSDAAAYVRVSNLAVRMNNIPIQMWNGGVNTGLWEANGTFSVSNVSVATVANRVFYVNTATGDMRVGKLGPNLSNMSWTASTGLLALYNNTTPYVQLSSTGVVTVGPVLASRSRIILDSGAGEGIRMVWRDGANTDQNRIMIGNDGNVWIYNGNLDVGTGAITWGSPTVGRADANGIRVTANLGTGGTQLRSYSMVDNAGDLIGYYSGYQNGSINTLSIRTFQKPSTSGTTNIELYVPNGNIVMVPTNGLVQIESGYLNIPSGYVNTLSGFFTSNGGSAASPTFGLQGGGVGMYFNGVSQISFGVSSAERVRFTAQGVGSNPASGGSQTTPAFYSVANTNSGVYFSSGRTTLTSGGVWGLVVEGGRAQHQTGAANNPSVTFESDNFSGMYLVDTGVLGWSTNGTHAMTLDNLNILTINGGARQQLSAKIDMTTTGWRKLAKFTGRGQGRFLVFNTGGSASPFYAIVEVNRSWTTGKSSLHVVDVASSVINAYRITNDGTDAYLEASFTATANSVYIQQEVTGNSLPTTLYGSPVSGSGTIECTAYCYGGLSQATTDVAPMNRLYGTYFDGDVNMQGGTIIARTGSWGTGINFGTTGFQMLSTSNYFLIAHPGNATVLGTRLDNVDSTLNLGYGNTYSRASIVNLFSDGAASTTVSAQVHRVAGTNGEFRLYNRGTGDMTFYTNGTLSGKIETNGSNAAFQMADGTSSVPAYSFINQTGLGMFRNATNSMQFVAPGVIISTVSVALNRSVVAINSTDSGAGGYGPTLAIGRNTNSPNGGPGFWSVANRTGTTYRFWVDNSGTFRIGNTVDPFYPNEGSGQGTAIITLAPSALKVKDILGDPITGEEALAFIRTGAAAVRPFRYKAHNTDMDRPYNGEQFSGIIVDYAPRYGMDDGNLLNMVNAIGDLMIGTDHLHDRIRQLEAEVTALKAQLM